MIGAGGKTCVGGGESDFTLDKQLDFNKLLEGSRFFGSGSQRTPIGESWRDR